MVGAVAVVSIETIATHCRGVENGRPTSRNLHGNMIIINDAADSH